MCQLCDRRAFIAMAAAAGAAAAGALPLATAHGAGAEAFLAEAERMRKQAVDAGDQAYGAVLVMDGRIVGFGPSRVITDRNLDAHAERVAIWAAQAALGRKDLSGAILYSTSRPCRWCEAVAADANVARMIHGSGAGRDAGRPQLR